MGSLLQRITEAKASAWRRLTTPVGRNVISLYVLQFGNYVLPLVTVPYLVRVLGPEKFGLVAFGQGLMAYFSLMVNYGFDWSATRKIAVERDNPESVNRTAGSVWGAKALLCAATAVILVVLVLSVPRLSKVSLLLFVLFGSVVGNMLFPTWLFQGLERMTAISVTNLVVRTLGAVAIFVFIREPGDFLRYAVVLSAQGLAAGLIGAGVALKLFRLRMTAPSWREMRREIAGSSPLFLSTAAASMYASGNAFILGLLASPAAVGYYSAAEKIVNAAIRLLGPLSQSVFPRINKLASDSKELALRAGRKVLLFLGSIGLGMTAVLILAAPFVVRVVLGAGYSHSTRVLQILSINIFNLSVATVWSTLMMICFKRDRAVMTLLFAAGALNLGLAWVLVPLYGEEGMAVAVVCAETLVNIGSFAYTWVHDLNPARIALKASVRS